MTDFGEISPKMREHMKEALLLLRRPTIFTKMIAIQKIKAQPFFGKPILPEPKGDTVKFRRPIPYTITIRDKND